MSVTIFPKFSRGDSAADVRDAIGVYSTTEVDNLLAGLGALTSEDIDTLAEINTILTDANLASIAYVDGLAANYATAAQGALADSALQPSDITSGTITAGTGDIDFDALGGGLENFTEAIATASPNNVVNVASFTAQGDTTNVGVAIVPKGSGAFSLAVPDGTAAGGNARGAGAVDLQISRAAATQVASGSNSIAIGINNQSSNNQSVAIGGGNAATNTNSVAIGNACVASGSTQCWAIGGAASATQKHAISIGRNTVASGTGATAIGGFNTASGDYSLATGQQSLANRYGQVSHGGKIFGTQGDNQSVSLLFAARTTDDSPVSMRLDRDTIRCDVRSGAVFSFKANITGIKSDGSAVAHYIRKGCIKNVGGTTSLVGSVETIGTDHEDNAATDVTITADDTNDALDISVTGIAGETWRWVAVVEGLEIGYGT